MRKIKCDCDETSFLGRTSTLASQHPFCYSFILFDMAKNNIIFRKNYSGYDAAENFLLTLKTKMPEWYEILMLDVKPLNMSYEEEMMFQNSEKCYICSISKDNSLPFHRDHDWSTGKYLGSACPRCNLTRQRYKKINIYAHNFKGYDSHFLIQSLDILKQSTTFFSETEKPNTDFLITPPKLSVKILPKNTQQILTLRIGPFLFLDSMSFLNSSLANSVNMLVNDDHDFPYVKMFGYSENAIPFVTRKGVFPYDWVKSLNQLKECHSLPPKKFFYSILTSENISDEDYDFALRFWRFFRISNMLEYTLKYCEIDVLLLAECFLRFRSQCLENFNSDICHNISLPSYAYTIMLKMTKATIYMPPTIEMFNYIAKAIRGGFAFINSRLFYSLLPNSSREKKFKEKIKKIEEEMQLETRSAQQNILRKKLRKLKKAFVHKAALLIDANNLYGHSMTFPLPIGGMRWVSKKVLKQMSFDYYKNYDFDDEYGYIAEVTLVYPKHLHYSHASFPVAPQSMELTPELLSPFQKKCYTVLGKKIKNFKEKNLFPLFYLGENMLFTVIISLFIYNLDLN